MGVRPPPEYAFSRLLFKFISFPAFPPSGIHGWKKFVIRLNRPGEQDGRQEWRPSQDRLGGRPFLAAAQL
jgi:hypothetical protein